MADGQSKKVGINGMKEHLEAVRNTYPDYRMRILRQFEDNGFVISEFIMEGTFMNEWQWEDHGTFRICKHIRSLDGE